MTKSPLNVPRSSRGARGLLCFAFAATFSHAAADAPKVVQQFLGKYCLECHDADVQKGDRVFDAFALPLKSVPDLIDARDIIDQLTLKEMPPKKAEQPKDDKGEASKGGAAPAAGGAAPKGGAGKGGGRPLPGGKK